MVGVEMKIVITINTQTLNSVTVRVLNEGFSG